MSRKRNPKYDEAAKMYDAGMSIRDVASYYGITHQAMWKILKRRTALRPQLRYKEDNHFYRGGATAEDRAHNLTEQAIVKGVLKVQPCEVCGKLPMFRDGRVGVQAHHDDYNKPLEVRWLCQPHHHEWHKFNKAIPLED